MTFSTMPPGSLSQGRIRCRYPTRADGAAVWRLVRSCGKLDDNSMYCNLLQCDHFAETCVVAERDGEIVGWVSGYIVPDDPQALFIWQVAVQAAARGRGVAKAMLQTLLAREACADVTRLETTITPDNVASWALFSSLADSFEADLDSRPYFRRHEHFDGEHATEHLVRIAFEQASSAAA